ncbi:MAG: hypothetical protein SOX31_09935 [Eubacteriales bacterium]|nr:hypothetical protein [Clostridiales bacterium]MDY3071036.1 hypothetical protein [Eubacteriales bacterium]MDY3286870.1 hypothetical protein [Eubacteriales bacterium]MDY5016494.1 hypothetical protein [Eubacteriales bacterium]
MRSKCLCIPLTLAVFALFFSLSALFRTVTPLSLYRLQLVGGELRLHTAGRRDYAVLREIDTGGLPAADRARLSKGIVLSSEEALDRFLENYGS